MITKDWHILSTDLNRQCLAKGLPGSIVHATMYVHSMHRVAVTDLGSLERNGWIPDERDAHRVREKCGTCWGDQKQGLRDW